MTYLLVILVLNIGNIKNIFPKSSLHTEKIQRKLSLERSIPFPTFAFVILEWSGLGPTPSKQVPSFPVGPFLPQLLDTGPLIQIFYLLSLAQRQLFPTLHINSWKKFRNYLVCFYREEPEIYRYEKTGPPPWDLPGTASPQELWILTFTSVAGRLWEEEEPVLGEAAG